MNLKHKDYIKSLILILVFFINSVVLIAGPFSADLRDGFLIQDLGSGNIRVNQIDLVTGTRVKVQELAVGGSGNNAYGYNPKDNYIYGIQVTAATGNDTYNLVRIEPTATGFTFTKKPITGLVHNIDNGMFIGDFDKDGNMYVAGDGSDGSAGGPIFKIIINTDGSGSATKLSIDRGSPRFADWGYTDRVGGTERFYFISDGGSLYYFTKSGSTLTKSSSTASNLTTGGNTVVGTFVAGTDLFYYPSGSSQLYKVDLLNPTAGSQPFSNVANPSNNGDAARNYQIVIPALALGKEVTNGTTFTQGSDIRYKLTIKNAGDYPLGDPAFNSHYTVTDTINSQKVTTTATAVTAKLYNSLTGTTFTNVTGFPTTINYVTVDSTTSKFELKSDGGSLPKIPKGYRLEIEYTLKSKIYSFVGDQDQILNTAVGTVPGKSVTSDAQVSIIATPPELGILKSVDKTTLLKGDILQYTLELTNKSTSKSFTGVVVKDILKADITQVFETFSVYDSNGTTLIGEVIDTDGITSNNLNYTITTGETTINIGTIATLGPNATKKYILKGITKTNLTLSTLKNMGLADSNELDPIPSNEVTTVITGEKPFDYGDAPDTYKTITSNPPRHAQVANTPYFGKGVDYETVWTQPLGSNADLDDKNGSDDEDGIVSVNGVAYDSSLPILLIEGIENTITVNIGKVLSGGAKVKIWLDGLNGNINNGFDNNNSQVIYNATVNNTGNIEVKFPLSILGNRSSTAGKTYLRMRITSVVNDNQINSTGGVADDGEVEDYLVFISERKTDYGDLPDTYKTKLLSDGPRHLDVYLFGQGAPVGGNLFLGDTKTYENDAPVSLTGVEDTGDDGVKDSSGNILSTIYTNEDNVLIVKASSPGYIGVWVDFNGNGIFESGEGITQSVIAGNNTIVIPANRFTYDPGLVLTNRKGVRVRYASDEVSVNKPTGLAIGGEVEDYFIPFVKKVIDVTIGKAAPTSVVQEGTIAYTLTLTNTGNVAVKDYVLVDKPDTTKVDITQITGISILLDGQSVTGATFTYNTGTNQFELGGTKPEIPVGKSLVVNYTLKSKLFDIATNNQILNTATVITGNVTKNAVANVGVITNKIGTLDKSTSTPTINQEGVATYTLKVVNTGNVPLTGYILEDTPDLGKMDISTLVVTSIKVNGTSVTSPTEFKGDTPANPTKLMLVQGPTIPVGGTLEVVYTLKTKLFDTTTDNKIINTGSLALTQGGSVILDTAEVQITKVTGGTISKNAIPSEITLADKIPYEVTITNTGNTPILLSTLIDTIALEDRVYIQGVEGNIGTYILGGETSKSITVTYTTATGVITFAGLPEKLGVKEKIMIKYTLETKNTEYVSTNPNIENAAYVDLNGNGKVDAGETSTDPVKIVETKTGTIVKSSSQGSIDQNGVIDYTVAVTNTGNKAISTSLFKDIISTEDKSKIEKVVGKVEVALVDISSSTTGITYQEISATYNLTTGEVVFAGLPSAVPVGKKMLVKYSLQTTIFDITADDTINNKVQIDIDGDNAINNTTETSTAPVKVTSKTDVTIDKVSSTTTIGQGGTISYTLTVTNTGNTPVSNYTLVDKPDPTKVDVTQITVPSILLDGQPAVGATFTYNTTTNQFELGGTKPLIPVGKSLVVSYSLKSLVFDTSTNDKILNTAIIKTGAVTKEDTVSVTVNKNITATLEKTTSTPTINQEGVATYTLKVVNTGNTPLTGYILEDTPDLGKMDISTLVVTSIKVNGTLITSPTEFKGDSPANSTKLVLVQAPIIPVGGTLEIVYTMKSKLFDTTTDNKIINTGSLALTQGGSAILDTAEVQITKVTGGTISKNAIPSEITLADKIPYEVTITNTGNTPILLSTLIDTIALEDRVYIQGVEGNIGTYILGGETSKSITVTYTTATGVITFAGLPEKLGVKEKIVIKYTLETKNAEYVSTNPNIENAVYVDLNGNGKVDAGETSTDPVKIVETKTGTIVKSSSQGSIDQNGVIDYTVAVTNTGNKAISTSLFKDIISTEDKSKIEKVVGKVEVALVDISSSTTGITYQEISATYNLTTGEVVFAGLPSAVPVGKKMLVKYSLQTTIFDITADDTINNKVQIDIDGDNAINNTTETSTAPVKVTSKTDVTIDKVSSTTTIGQGGTISYTLTVTNTGNTPVSNYTLVDKPDPTKVDVTQITVPSILLDGQPAVGATFTYNTTTNQFELGGTKPLIPVGKSLVVSYSLKSLVFDTSTNDKILNTAIIKTGAVTKEDTVSVTVNKNITATLEKTTSTPTINQEGVATYTLKVVNTGNTPLTGYILEDTPDLTKMDISTLVVTSIKVNGTLITSPTEFKGDSPANSTKLVLVQAPIIPVGGTLEIVYTMKSKLFDTTTDNKIINTGSLALTQGGSAILDTAEVQITKVTGGTISKNAIPSEITLADKIPYEVTITNTGNTPILLSTLIDTIALEDRVYIQGVEGNIGTYILGGETSKSITVTYTTATGVITFAGLPEKLGVKEKIVIKYTLETKNAEYVSTNPNIENAVYVDLNGNGKVDAGETSTDPVKIVETKTGTIVKSSSQGSIDQNGVIDYTVAVTNTGNKAISTSLFKDIISTEDKSKIEKVVGKVEVALVDISSSTTGITYQEISATYNLTTGEVVFAGLPSAVPVGKKMLVKYSLQTTIFDITADDTINNKVQIDIDGDNAINNTTETSTAPVKVTSKTDVTIDKVSSTTTIGQGGTISYTLTVTNTGNTPVSNYTLVDKPDPTKVDVTQITVPSILLDGQPAVGATFTYNTTTNQFELGGTKPLIPVGKSLVVSYSLKSLVFDTSTNDKILNTAIIKTGAVTKEDTVSVTVNKNITATLEKTTSTPTINQEGVATYTLKVVNTGNTPLTGYILEDTPDLGKMDISTLVVTSIKVNGTLITSPTEFKGDSPANSTKLVLVQAPIIPVGGTLEIVYTMKSKLFDTTTDNKIINTGSLALTQGGSAILDTAEVQITKVTGGTISKNAIPSEITLADKIPYEVTITNTGNKAISTSLFKDIISTEDKSKIEKVVGKVEVALVDISSSTTGITYQEISATYNLTTGEVVFAGLPSAIPVGKKMLIKYSLQTTIFDITADDTINNKVQIDIDGDNAINNTTETSTASVKVTSKIDILLEKTTPVTTIVKGEDITYTIKITNLGNIPLKNYILEDTPEIDKINSDTLKNVTIKLNDLILDSKSFVFNKASNKFELVGEKPIIPLNGVLEITYTLTSNSNMTNINLGITNIVNFKMDNINKEASVVVNLSTMNITKISNNENQVLQGGDEVIYTIVLKTSSKNEQQVLVKDNLLEVNNYNNLSFLKIEDIKDIKINGILINNGKEMFTKQGLNLIIPGTTLESDTETIITYTLTIPKDLSEEIAEIKNEALVIKNEVEIRTDEVVIELAKPKLILRHDVFKFENKYNDTNQILLEEKPIAENIENIEGKNSKPPIVFAGDDILYFVSLVNKTKVPMKGKTDINHQLDSKQLKDDNGLNVFVDNKFLGVIVTSLDTGEKVFYSKNDLSQNSQILVRGNINLNDLETLVAENESELKDIGTDIAKSLLTKLSNLYALTSSSLPTATNLGITNQESSFEFQQIVPSRSVVSFVVKSTINPKGSFAKSKQISTYAYLPSDPLQNTSEGELRKTVIVLGRKNTDLVLSKRSEIEEASVGKFVPYIIQIKNVGEDSAVDVYIQDKIPPGFVYVEGSAVQVLNESYSENKITTTGIKEIKFGPISEIKSGDIVKIKYLLKVGVGVKPGTYKNIAVSVDKTDKTISNPDSVDIEIVSDPIFEHTTIIGKVFHDRDGDGIQDYATAKNVVIDVNLPKNYYIPNTTTVSKGGKTYDFSDSYSRITIREIKGRASELEPATNNMIVIRKELIKPIMASVRVQTNRGTDITQQGNGEVITNHTGDKIKGMTSQDIVVTQRVIKNKDNKIILEIFILNNGIQEEGLPGVRLATPEGIVVETDRFGRYHVPPVPETLGKNYIIKVDPTTLPKGAEFTTENPRVRHLGKVMMKFNFGVKLPPLKNPEKKDN